jgi:hypothetical protein
LPEPKGVVFTKPWVVELLLDLAGYVDKENLVDSVAVEPAAGEGAFLGPMALRLIRSCRRQGRPVSDCSSSLIAYELNDASVDVARLAVTMALHSSDIPREVAEQLARHWVRGGDYLLEAPQLPPADFVIGNPPYIRLEDIPPENASLYRDAYPTMRGRADLYVAFFEAGLRQLRSDGVCSFICADRWMLNQYGGELRRLVTRSFSVETVVEMHNANAFYDDVSAYPAITVIRRASQGQAVVASIGADVNTASGQALATSLRSADSKENRQMPTGVATTVVDRWFSGSDPWPCGSPARLAILRQLEDRFEPMESEVTGTRVGIGVATGLDKVFITQDDKLVESSRLLPLAMAQDTASGKMAWSGRYLVNPWDRNGLVNLNHFPRLASYLETHQEALKSRHTAQKNRQGWYRTIDRVTMELTKQPKLYIHDIKDCFNPVLDTGETYPHHNLYFIVSEKWNLEVLGGLLLSSVGQLFIEAYGVRMRGGYLRFQAQYLRRIRMPKPETLTQTQSELLVKAFQQRDRTLASAVAHEVYQIHLNTSAEGK